MKYVIYCEDVSNDKSEFELRCERNGEIVEREGGLYSFEDVMIECYNFFRKVCDKYYPDTGIDILEVNLNYRF
jgi:hypothetical protein